jgi:hypothetical protein
MDTKKVVLRRCDDCNDVEVHPANIHLLRVRRSGLNPRSEHVCTACLIARSDA